MSRRFESGVRGAKVQTAVMVGITGIIVWGVGHGPDPELMAWIYLLCAGAVIVVPGTEPWAGRMRAAAGRLLPRRPSRALMFLKIRAMIAAIALAVLTLAPAPRVWAALVGLVAPAWVAALLWSGAMSIGVAGFGMLARTASVAGDRRRRQGTFR